MRTGLVYRDSGMSTRTISRESDALFQDMAVDCVSDISGRNMNARKLGHIIPFRVQNDDSEIRDTWILQQSSMVPGNELLKI
ncbi:hypothetical protein MPTK1_8g05190 [Marchantia polymorpha subsp. ruderalis]|uniref:Uncharacterized protein n=1 Tax=Marchantia polymorpha TaxID=3197 RepID=A0A2R6WK98_MARPO|nr:hypothetical protein MARPO_0081s0020 [Marchantia polymorpha]BBN18751.1 hypothetical protein Mp_8g05190 [Marchantia polymorpha subsp. ruderalis]|eukprot:PTQ34290.1 hypothetical protein MARPO_0081s0020 [Marchantia polymorpha]